LNAGQKLLFADDLYTCRAKGTNTLRQCCKNGSLDTNNTTKARECVTNRSSVSGVSEYEQGKPSPVAPQVQKCSDGSSQVYYKENDQYSLKCLADIQKTCDSKESFSIHVEPLVQNIKTYSCIYNKRYSKCVQSNTMQCEVGNNMKLPKDGWSSCINNQNILMNCNCNIGSDGMCYPKESVAVQSSALNLNLGTRSFGSGGLVEKNGSIYACTIRHVTDGALNSDIRVEGRACRDKSVSINATRFRFESNAPDSSMCAKLDDNEIAILSSCTSTAILAESPVNVGDNIYYTTQSGVQNKCTVIEYRPNTQEILTDCTDVGCVGDSGSQAFNEKGEAVAHIASGLPDNYRTNEGATNPDSKAAGLHCSKRQVFTGYNAKTFSSINADAVAAAKPKIRSSLISPVSAASPSSVSKSLTVDSGSYKLNDGTTLNTDSSKTNIEFIEDVNGNGKWDIGEPKVGVINLELRKLAAGFSYNIINGWNALNFPFYKDTDKPYTANGLIAAAAGQGIEISSVKKWEGKWVEFTLKDGIAYGQDFNLRPNEGYFIRAHSKGSITLYGAVPDKPIPLQTLNGWSLIGVAPGQGSDKNKNYTKQEFKDGINAFEFIKVFNASDPELKINNVTKYDDGVYRGVAYSQGSDGKFKEFGLDFVLEEQRAYFIRSYKKTVVSP
jgi:hypothetical protein